MTGAAYRAMIAKSSCVSSDAGHGVHPNYVEKFDPANHPLLNEGHYSRLTLISVMPLMAWVGLCGSGRALLLGCRPRTSCRITRSRAARRSGR